MFTTLIASAAVLASTALASSPGSAIVINSCTYDVSLNSVPAQYGGYEETDHTLSPGQSWSQEWTQLSNGAGWSIKLAKEAGAASIMQYEYTFQNDGTIWYDLSEVNGNPWNGDWEITATGSCTPKQQAYRYDTDDAYGEQSCDSVADITVTLCSGESQADAIVSSLAVEATAAVSQLEAALPLPAATTSSTTTPTPAPPAPTTTSTSTTAAAPTAQTTTTGHGLAYDGGAFYANQKANAATTLSTVTSATATSVTTHAAAVVAVDDDDDTVIVWTTVVETAYAYETYVPGKRHVHHPDHPHFR